MKNKWILKMLFEIFKFVFWSYLFVFFSLTLLYLLFWWISFSINIWWFQLNLWNDINNTTNTKTITNTTTLEQKKDATDTTNKDTTKFVKNSEWKYEWWHLLEYTEDNFKKALLWWDQVLLLFKANWCSSCKVLEEEIQEQWIPRWILIMYVDFDKEFELRKKYKVNNQHTVVYVDQQWNEVNRDLWWDYNAILSKTL